eukprot:gb/GECG01007629.1/.p1 GENE.gb/GECG01007629.1/~~gb/GECG01007629.1/.p1  ORF type:complete len:1503 (+),score=198.81 gb/GECG01007629.1/:1-4509(+)
MPYVNFHINELKSAFAGGYFMATLASLVLVVNPSRDVNLLLLVGIPLACIGGSLACRMMHTAVLGKPFNTLQYSYEISIWARRRIHIYETLKRVYGRYEQFLGTSEHDDDESSSLLNKNNSSQDETKLRIPMEEARLLELGSYSVHVDTLESLQGDIERAYRSMMDKFPDSGNVLFEASTFFKHYMDNLYMEMRALSQAKRMCNAPDIRFVVYQRLRQIREGSTANSSQELNAVDRVLFDQKWAQATEEETNVYKIVHHLWSSLMAPVPRISQLDQDAEQITKALSKADSLYKDCLKLNPESVSALRSYGNFARTLRGEEELAQTYLSKADRIEESSGKATQSKIERYNFKEQLRDSLGEDEHSAVIVISGDPSSAGEIVEVNTAACSLFGISSGDLIGNNISILIPRPFSALHSTYLTKFGSTGRGALLNTVRSLFGLTGSSNLIPLVMKIREIPPRVDDATASPRFSAVLHSPQTDESFILFDNDRNKHQILHADSSSLSQILGVAAEELEDEELYIGDFIPSLKLVEDDSTSSGLQKSHDSTSNNAGNHAEKAPDVERARSFLASLETGSGYATVKMKRVADTTLSSVLARVQTIPVTGYGTIFLFAWKRAVTKSKRRKSTYNRRQSSPYEGFSVSQSSCPVAPKKTRAMKESPQPPERGDIERPTDTSPVCRHSGIVEKSSKMNASEEDSQGHSDMDTESQSDRNLSEGETHRVEGAVSTQAVKRQACKDHAGSKTGFAWNEGRSVMNSLRTSSTGSQSRDRQPTTEPSNRVAQTAFFEEGSLKRGSESRGWGGSQGQSSYGTTNSVKRLLHHVIVNKITGVKRILARSNVVMAMVVALFLTFAISSVVEVGTLLQRAIKHERNIQAGSFEEASFISTKSALVKAHLPNSKLPYVSGSVSSTWKNLKNKMREFIETSSHSRELAADLGGKPLQWEIQERHKVINEFTGTSNVLSTEELRDFLYAHLRQLRSASNGSNLLPGNTVHEAVVLLDNANMATRAFNQSAQTRKDYFRYLRDEYLSNAKIGFFVVMGILVAGYSLMVSYFIYQLDGPKKEILKSFLMIPLKAIKKMRQSASQSLKDHLDRVGEAELFQEESDDGDDESAGEDHENDGTQTASAANGRALSTRGVAYEPNENMPQEQKDSSVNINQRAITSGRQTAKKRPSVKVSPERGVYSAGLRKYKDSKMLTWISLLRAVSPIVLVVAWTIFMFNNMENTLASLESESTRVFWTEQAVGGWINYEESLTLLFLRVPYSSTRIGNATTDELESRRRAVFHLRDTSVYRVSSILHGNENCLPKLPEDRLSHTLWTRSACSIFDAKTKNSCSTSSLQHGLRAYIRGFLDRGLALMSQLPSISKPNELAMQEIEDRPDLQKELKKFNEVLFPMGVEAADFIANQGVRESERIVDSALQKQEYVTITIAIAFAVSLLAFSVPTLARVGRALDAACNLLVLIPEELLDNNQCLRKQVRYVIEHLAASSDKQDAAMLLATQQHGETNP